MPAASRRPRRAAFDRAAAVVAGERVRAARRERRSGTFSDPVSLDDVPLRHGVTLNRQMYEPRGLKRWVNERGTVPHSRRPVTAQEKAFIARAARLAGGGEGWEAAWEMFESGRGGAGSRRSGAGAGPAVEVSSPTQLAELVKQALDSRFAGWASGSARDQATYVKDVRVLGTVVRLLANAGPNWRFVNVHGCRGFTWTASLGYVTDGVVDRVAGREDYPPRVRAFVEKAVDVFSRRSLSQRARGLTRRVVSAVMRR